MNVFLRLSAVTAILCLSACDREGAGTATPEESAAAPASAKAGPEGVTPAEPASAQVDGSTCPEGKGPGDTWTSDCNTCYCSEDGKVACTLMACMETDLDDPS